MNHLLMAAMLTGLCVAPGRAEGTYEANVGARFVDLDSKRNKQWAMEYDGKQYKGAHGDVSVGNQGELGLFDFSLTDIGSKEEIMSFNLDYKSTFKASAKWDAMHHRMNPTRHGQIINGVWRPAHIVLTTGVNRYTFTPGTIRADFTEDPNFWDFKLRRVVSEVNLGLFAPEDSAKYLTLQYYAIEKTGSRFVVTATDILGEADIDHTQTDLTLGLGTSIKESAAVNVDVVRAEFNERVTAKAESATSAVPLLPEWPRHQMTAVETKWRYDATKKLSLNAALTGRQRENLVNLYKFNAGVAAFNAAYRATNKLSLTAKTYVRYFEVDENQGFRGFNSGGAQGNTHHFDRLQARQELTASFRPVEKVRTKATYKIEMNHRRDAPSEDFGEMLYADGLFVASNTRSNNLSNDDVKHIMLLSASVDLPLDAGIEGYYKKLYANRPAFINMPTRQDEVGGQFMMPLPGNVQFSLGGTYSKERNANEATNHHMSRNSYRTGLDWEKNSKFFVGADASYEIIRYNSENYYQSGINSNINKPHESGALNRQRNTTAGLHGRVVCPKGFVVLGNGSYTWSVVQNPVNFGWPLAAAGSHPAGTYINDIMPGEARIARGTVGLEYTPEKLPSLTARASYTVTDYVDKVDSFNSGRASIAQVGASMKF
ncbi:MAG: hypothetical protein Q8T11_09385 [Elusimicrobiota bacterium]|nr:hypothetical protein [Elusimicrobiota bacterium]